MLFHQPPVYWDGCLHALYQLELPVGKLAQDLAIHQRKSQISAYTRKDTHFYYIDICSQRYDKLYKFIE